MIRVRIHKSRTLTSGFRCGQTDREYSPLWPKVYIYSEYESKVLNTGEFCLKWCYDAREAIQAENSRLLSETGRCSWTSGDYVSMPDEYYVAEFNEHMGY